MRCLFLGLPLLAVACAEQAPDPRGVERDEVLLQIAATGQADARPDQARFSAGVDTIAPSAGQASSGNAAAMNRVTAALERLGIKPDDMQTRAITLNRIDYGPNRGRFQASNVLEVRVRELPRAGEAIAAATEAGANILSGPNLTIADPEAAGRSAYANAYKAARARADAYAEAAGMKVARLLAIRDTGEAGPQPYHGDALMSAATAAPPPIVRAPPVRPGVSTAQVSVRADFALAEK